MIIQQNYSLKNHNTFGLDVYAKYFVKVSDEAELLELLSQNKFKNEKKLIIGGGSNILFTKDYDGIVIQQTSNRISAEIESDSFVKVTAAAGVVWHNLVQYCVERNFGGIENLSLIPGHAGAAPIQNIGAYGQELKDVFVSLHGIFIDDLVQVELNSEQCRFAYRESIFKNELKNKFIITQIHLKLFRKPRVNLSYSTLQTEIDKLNAVDITIKDVSELICRIRKSKLPDPTFLGNAGSFFKNPEISKSKFEELKKKFPEIPGHKISENQVKIPAAWLIEKCGLKGIRENNAGIYEKQAVVIINYGDARPSDIIKLAQKIKKIVNEVFDIKLIEEVNII